MSIPTEANNILINQLTQHFVGLADNDGTGEMLRKAFIKVNENLELMLTRVGLNKTDFITEKLDTLETNIQDILAPVTYTHRVTLRNTGVTNNIINKPVNLNVDLKGRTYALSGTNLEDGEYPHVSLVVRNNRIEEVLDNTDRVIKPGDAAGGDLDRTYPNPRTVALRQTRFEATTPTIVNQVYAFDGVFLLLRNLTDLIGPAAGDMSGPYLNNRVVGFQDRPVSSGEPGPFNVYIWNNPSAQWEPGRYITTITSQDVADKLPNMGGDVVGRYNSNIVSGIQGRPILNTAPSTNQALRWNGAAWSPANMIRENGAIVDIPRPPAPPPPPPTNNPVSPSPNPGSPSPSPNPGSPSPSPAPIPIRSLPCIPLGGVGAFVPIGNINAPASGSLNVLRVGKQFVSVNGTSARRLFIEFSCSFGNQYDSLFLQILNPITSSWQTIRVFNYGQGAFFSPAPTPRIAVFGRPIIDATTAATGSAFFPSQDPQLLLTTSTTQIANLDFPLFPVTQYGFRLITVNTQLLATIKCLLTSTFEGN